MHSRCCGPADHAKKNQNKLTLPKYSPVFLDDDEKVAYHTGCGSPCIFSCIPPCSVLFCCCVLCHFTCGCEIAKLLSTLNCCMFHWKLNNIAEKLRDHAFDIGLAQLHVGSRTKLRQRAMLQLATGGAMGGAAGAAAVAAAGDAALSLVPGPAAMQGLADEKMGILDNGRMDGWQPQGPPPQFDAEGNMVGEDDGEKKSKKKVDERHPLFEVKLPSSEVKIGFSF